MKRLKGFTLAEVLITLAIIGVVAAISIPSVISNSQQQEFKTGLRKAVSVLNSAITMNMAIDGESPLDNADLYHYLQRHMSVMHSHSNLDERFYSGQAGEWWHNSAFYTTDGMRFEFWAMGNGGTSTWDRRFVLYENNNLWACIGSTASPLYPDGSWGKRELCSGGCGSYGLNSNSDKTTSRPCIITVDVNGDRKPNPNNVNCHSQACAKRYIYSDPQGLRLTDVFSIMITDKQAIPYGVAAQRAMYQAQAKK